MNYKDFISLNSPAFLSTFINKMTCHKNKVTNTNVQDILQEKSETIILTSQAYYV